MEAYTLNCPHCGQVEGYVACAGTEDDLVPEDADTLIEEGRFETADGPVTRCRCPQCGAWIDEDLAEPA